MPAIAAISFSYSTIFLKEKQLSIYMQDKHIKNILRGSPKFT